MLVNRGVSTEFQTIMTKGKKKRHLNFTVFSGVRFQFKFYV
jgi:hypothetical protein